MYSYDLFFLAKRLFLKRKKKVIIYTLNNQIFALNRKRLDVSRGTDALKANLKNEYGGKITMKKLFAVFLTVFITISLSQTFALYAQTDYSGGTASNDPIAVAFDNRDGALDKLSPQSGIESILAVQFNATAAFNGIGIHSPTWSATQGYYVDYSLYKYEYSYEESIKNAPVLTAKVESWTDGNCAQAVFDEIPAGEYLLVAAYGITDENVNVGAWYIGEQFEGQRSYIDGEIWEDTAIVTTVFYTSTPNNLYGPLSPADGVRPAPVTPADPVETGDEMSVTAACFIVMSVAAAIFLKTARDRKSLKYNI